MLVDCIRCVWVLPTWLELLANSEPFFHCCSLRWIHVLPWYFVGTVCLTHWRYGTGFSLCAITASVVAFPSCSGTAAKYP